MKSTDSINQWAMAQYVKNTLTKYMMMEILKVKIKLDSHKL